MWPGFWGVAKNSLSCCMQHTGHVLDHHDLREFTAEMCGFLQGTETGKYSAQL